MISHRVQGLTFVAVCLLVGGVLAFASLPRSEALEDENETTSAEVEVNEATNSEASFLGSDGVDAGAEDSGDADQQASGFPSVSDDSVFTMEDAGRLVCIGTAGKEFPVEWNSKAGTAVAQFGPWPMEGTVEADLVPASNTFVHSIELRHEDDSGEVSLDISDDGTISVVANGRHSEGRCRRAS